MDSSKDSTGPTNSGTSRRRSSGPSFDNLMNQKRGSDPRSMARRASLHEQKPTSGFIGQMWHNFTRGPQSPTK
ncbi:uncharacterized protein GGS25DRAFT_469592 [Hypoxylon fragiforme]|uniref:uncharacterized protein n=1 Tax=Hypoxylon fragiforme TaxID=63214 RepID=UPI0020C6BD3D|nr:uncharacterized protein GGS25DRAFT_469592 [Hypoxylon fragiforme]KAI2613915.1 hypothetical protein GGS25DRAFT_469592 [Hypoxylon fragiforme]